MSFGALLSGHFRTHTPSKERGGVRWAPTSFLKQKVTFHECQNPKHITSLNKKKKVLTGMFDPLAQFGFSSLAQTANFVPFARTKKTNLYSSYWSQVCYQSIGYIGAAVVMLPSIGHIGAAVVMLPKYRTYWCSSGDVTKVSGILVQQWWCYQSIGHIGAAVVMQACRPVI